MNAEQVSEEFWIESNRACVAERTHKCWSCSATINAFCIYCESGTVDGDSCTNFTVVNVSAVDDVLKEQLKKWPNFRLAEDREMGSEYFQNHCPQCGAAQSDMRLHTEPGGPFFAMKAAPKGSIKFIPLQGTVRLNGEEGFER